MVEVLSPDPGIYVLRVIWHPVFVNFNGRLKTGLYSLTESQNFTMLVDYKLPNRKFFSQLPIVMFLQPRQFYKLDNLRELELILRE